MRNEPIVICGAGILGVTLAAELAERGLGPITLVEQGDPLALTSDKSSECYRNWWPGPDGAMVALMNESIDRLEALAAASNNQLRLNRRGYLYASADPNQAERWQAEATLAAAQGAGSLRLHPSATNHNYQPTAPDSLAAPRSGADLITDPALIRQFFSFLDEDTRAVLHARRGGWLSAQQFGSMGLERARQHGVRLLRGRIASVDHRGGRLASVAVTTEAGTQTLACSIFVNAAGPLLDHVAAMLDGDLPIINERHLKVAFAERLGAVPRHAPMLIWADPIDLPWFDDERADLAADPSAHWLLEKLPAGVHCRPEGEGGSSILLMLWDYHREAVEPRFPVPIDPDFPEIVLRGLSRMIPGLRLYFGKLPRPAIDGGYYTRTRENRPLISSLPIEGAYVLGAFSGYGIMAAPGAAARLADQIEGKPLAPFAEAFDLARYNDPAYQARLADWGDLGQL